MYVHYSNPNVLTIARVSGDDFMFIPGNNNVSVEMWNEFQKNPNVVRRIKSGVLRVTSEVETGDEESPLTLLGSADAKIMVRETYDPVMLRKWKHMEGRKTVISVIDEQLEAADKRIAERQSKSKNDQDDE